MTEQTLRTTAERIAAEGYVQAVATIDTVPAMAARIDRLLASKRRITRIARYLGQGGRGSLTVRAGLYPSPPDSVGARRVGLVTNKGKGQPWDGATYWQPLDGGTLLDCISIGAYTSEGTEEQQLVRLRSSRPTDVTLVEIDGWGDGRQDRVVITTWNQHGVGEEVTFAFDQVTTKYQAAQGADMLDALSDHVAEAEGKVSVRYLRRVAGLMRKGWWTVTDAADAADRGEDLP